MDETVNVLKLELELAEIKYNSELRREESIVQQSGRMQSAVSIVIAAVFVIATILSQHTKIVSYKLSIVIISSIVVILLTSLVLASLAQARREQTTWSDIKKQKENIENHEEQLTDEKVRLKYVIDQYELYQNSLTANNRIRVKRIELSRKVFYIAIGMSLMWFVVVICIVYGGH